MAAAQSGVPRGTRGTHPFPASLPCGPPRDWPEAGGFDRLNHHGSGHFDWLGDRTFRRTQLPLGERRCYGERLTPLPGPRGVF